LVAAVGPRKHFGAVVRREDDDRVIGYTHVVEMLQQQTHVVVELRHAGFLDPVVGFVVLHRAVLLR